MKEIIHPKADLNRIILKCNSHEHTFKQCRERCVNKCQRYYDLLLAMEEKNAIAHYKKFWRDYQKAEAQDAQIENAYEARAGERWMLGYYK